MKNKKKNVTLYQGKKDYIVWKSNSFAFYDLLKFQGCQMTEQNILVNIARVQKLCNLKKGLHYIPS